MPITDAKRDGNVPFIGPRARYNILGAEKVWMRQDLTGAALLDGLAPARVATPDPNDTDPTSVTAGRVVWDDLSQGGLFRALGNLKQAVVITRIEGAGNTYTIVDKDGNLLRGGPANNNDVPFALAPSEYFKAVGGEFCEICVERASTRIL